MGKVEVIILTICPASHLKPAISLAKLLLNSSSSLIITIFTAPSFSPYMDSFTPTNISSSASPDLRFESLLSVLTSFPDPQSPHTFFTHFANNTNPILRSTLSRRLHAKTHPIAAVIIDPFCWPAIDIARELGLPAYFFVTWSAAMLSYALHLPSASLLKVLHKSTQDVPGIGDIPAACTPEYEMDERTRGEFAESWRKLREARRFVVNTFEELEPSVLEAISCGECVSEGATPQVFAVGPIIGMEEDGEGNGERELIGWLDQQPQRSVLFICLGSMGSLGIEQIEEVAIALEDSGQKFLWVLRTPIPNHMLNLPKDTTNLEEVLPMGFIKRTKDKGIVWPTWAPQMKILSHHAIGGFVTHCGWNSCLESLWHGVPTLAWPLFFDQHINAINMAQQLQLGLELRKDGTKKNFVVASNLKKGIEDLMGVEGRMLREKVEDIRSSMKQIVAKHGVMDSLVEKLVKECPIFN